VEKSFCKFFEKKNFLFINNFLNREYNETDSKTEETISICIIEAKNGDQFKGCGRNKKMAKYDACRRAIQMNIT